MIVKVLDLLHQRAANYFLIVPAALLCLGISSYGLFTVLEEKYADLTTYEDYPFFLQIRQVTEPDDLFLIPSQLTPFRLGAQRSPYADWKSHPYKGEEVLEWWDRIAFLDEFYSEETTASRRQRLCSSVGADYYVLKPKDAGNEEVVLLASRKWVLIACP